MGRNTMQMASVETNAGTAICCGAIQNRFLNFLALGDIAVDVLNFDGGVVHQNADRERQSAQGHDVDGLAQRAHDDDGS